MFDLDKKVRLRECSIDDLDDRYRWYIDPETTKYLPLPEQLLTREEISNWIELNTIGIKKNYKHRAIIADEGAHIGWIDLNNIDENQQIAEIGIAIGEKNFRNRGYGYISLIEGLNWGFCKLQLEKIWLRVDENHISAINLYKKLNLSKDESFNESRNRNGERVKRVKMILAKNEYVKLNVSIKPTTLLV